MGRVWATVWATVLAKILAAIWVTAFGRCYQGILVLRKSLGRSRMERPARQLALVERIALSPRQSLALIEADGQRLLVGTSTDGSAVFFPLASAHPAAAATRSVRGSAKGSTGQGSTGPGAARSRADQSVQVQTVQAQSGQGAKDRMEEAGRREASPWNPSGLSSPSNSSDSSEPAPGTGHRTGRRPSSERAGAAGVEPGAGPLLHAASYRGRVTPLPFQPETPVRLPRPLGKGLRHLPARLISGVGKKPTLAGKPGSPRPRRISW